MQDYLNRIQGQIQKGAGGPGGFRGGFRGGMPGTPRIAAGVVGAVLLTGGFWLVQNGLFNVDGGHRAIKYRRTTGVSKEIFGEGAFYTI
jgi:prohibitin 2